VSAVATFDWVALAPVLAPALGAVLVLVVDAAAPRLVRLHHLLGLVALLAGLGFALPAAVTSGRAPLRSLCLPGRAGFCLYEAGPVATALQLAALGSAVVVLLLLWPDRRAALRGGPAVLVSLVLAATAGAAGVAGAHDLGSWLVCLELATLPVVALVALRGTAEAGRGALALLTTSLVSFALVVLGAALWLLATGQAVFAADAVAAALDDPDRRAVLLLGVLLLFAGVGFKLSLVPFHVWTPQAYAGGSEAVAAFLAATSKVAALAALVVVLQPLVAAGAPVLVAVGVVAAVTMTVGNLLALAQDDPVRLLAWSTVAQAGWVMLPLSASSPGSAAASGAYLVSYVVATLVAFVVVHVVSVGGAPRRLAAYTGLLRSRPLLGGALGLALLSLAGLPPGVVGLVAKVVALRPVVAQGQWLLALVAVANAVVGIAVYLRWFGVLLRDPEAQEVPDHGLLGGPVARPVLVALVLSGTVLVATSVLPQLLVGLLE
jgi:NADH-quinone oxidoreductase subunit N